MATIPVGRLAVATPETMAESVRNPTVARTAIDERVVVKAGELVNDMDPEMFAGPAADAIAAAAANGGVVASTDTHRIVTDFSRDAVMDDGDTLFVLNQDVGVNEMDSAISTTTARWNTASWSDEEMSSGVPVLRVIGGTGRQGRSFRSQQLDVEVLARMRLFSIISFQSGVVLRGQGVEGDPVTGYCVGVVGAVGNQRFTIYRADDDVVTLVDAVPFEYPIGSTHEADAMNIRARVDGGRVRGKVWKVTDDEPSAWMLDWTDPSPIPRGWAGVFSGDGSTKDWSRVSWNGDGGIAP